MNSMIQELWHGNIIPQEDSRTNSKEMKELLGYIHPSHNYPNRKGKEAKGAVTSQGEPLCHPCF